MNNYFNFLFSVCLCSGITLAVTSCKDTDDFFDKNKEVRTEADANDFDFSTTRNVDLQVEYNGFETLGPVRFSIYGSNPVVNENTEEQYVSKDIKPLLEVYTDEYGKFDQTLTLPAYAKELHIVTGNLAIGFSHEMVKVVNNEAKLVVKNDGSTQLAARSPRRASGPGELTNVLGKLKSTGYEVDGSGNTTSVQVYKEWGTPLGKWNTASGRPDYLMTEQEKAAKRGMVLTDDEVADMYNEACNILPNDNTLDNAGYRNSADVMLKEDSEITITALGSFTCWNTTLGYYYYGANEPTDRMHLNPIMLFPNTQDGMRYGTTGDYQGNIGSERGDVIQLMYYPHIANADPNVKYTDATTTFPKGTKIGFIIRTNGWGMMGKEYATKKTKSSTSAYNNAMNIWVSSTEGMSYAKGSFKYPNTTGEARTALFSYTTDANKKYCILAFEDACDDRDYNDLIFALNPANVFLGLNETEKDKTTTSCIYAFEDMWPSRGDYDMNDVIVDCKHQMEFTKGKVKTETFTLTTYQNVVEKVSGLAMRLNTKVKPSSIVMKKGPKDSNPTTFNFTKDSKEDIYYLTSDVKSEINSSYIFEITYSTAQTVDKCATIEPFLYGIRDGKNWEVHLPHMKPTNNMDMSFFGTENDYSNLSKGEYYVRPGYYPFAFHLEGASAEDFFDTILVTANESRPIDEFYPTFIQWSVSKGAKNTDWYLNPKK